MLERKICKAFSPKQGKNQTNAILYFQLLSNANIWVYKYFNFYSNDSGANYKYLYVHLEVIQ